MSTAELAALPPVEKWKMLEFLRESLRPDLENLPVPAEHQKLLDERRSAVADARLEAFEKGQIQVVDGVKAVRKLRALIQARNK